MLIANFAMKLSNNVQNRLCSNFELILSLDLYNGRTFVLSYTLRLHPGKGAKKQNFILSVSARCICLVSHFLNQ